MRPHSKAASRCRTPKASRPRATLLSDKAVLLYLALSKLVLHLVFNGRYGYFRDELYYIICGDRLAFGFVDHPPFTSLIARLSRFLFGDSLLGLRVFPAIWPRLKQYI